MKKTNNTFTRTVSLIICAALLFTAFSFSAAALNQQRRIVRVGFFAMDGYHTQDDSGTRSGYGYDLLQRMAGYTNWKFEYVGYEKSRNEMEEMLESGTIDLLTGVQKTEERSEKFDFSDRSVGTSGFKLSVKAGDSRYVLDDCAGWNGIRVGLLRSDKAVDTFAAFADKSSFAYKPIDYDSTKEMESDLLSDNRIDAIVTNSLRSVDDLWVLSRFAFSPFYVAVKKGNSELLSEVNNALHKMFESEPHIISQLSEKYYPSDINGEIPFTADERRFIEEMKDTTFTAIINPDRAPYSYLEDGKPTGIFYDIALDIIERSKLNIVFTDTQTRMEYGEHILANDTDIRFDAAYNYSQSEEYNCRLTVPYMTTTISRLHKRGVAEYKTAALLSNGDIAHRFGDEITSNGIEVTYYDSVGELIDAVSSGKQDMAYLNSIAATLAVQEDRKNSLECEKVFGSETQYAVAVNADDDALLYSILNKAVASISSSKVDEISKKYSQYKLRPFTVTGYIYDRPVASILVVITICLVMLLTIFIFMLMKKRRDDKLNLDEEKRRSQVLSDALTAAEKADEAKSHFLSSVSHEMRTPLNAIIGFMELAKSAKPQQVESYFTNCEIAAKQLLSVINDVLDMSSIESGKLKISHAPFDFKQMIHSMTNVYISQCRAKGITFETQILTPMDEWLVGDQLRVNQILMNLLGNAVKFTSEGYVHLKICQHDSEKSNETFVRLEVSDTGCGMSEEMQARLFKPFEQETSSTAKKFGGSGLGLSIVKNLVNMMDGAIKVESKQGKGSTFTVDLPFIKSELGAIARIPDNIDNLRVLVVDDEENERKYLSIVLGRMGIRHTCVGDESRAIEEMSTAIEEGAPYNVCLVDWKMPEKNGIDVTKKLRSKYGKDVVVIVVSAYEHDNADTVAKDAGANMFIVKPLFQSTLVDLFMTLSGGRIVKEMTGDKNHYNFKGRRILLAEDNAMNRMVAQGLIERFGAKCECAEDGLIALNKFCASQPDYYDAILMDIQMPNMDGFETAKAIRESDHPQAKSIAIIALTANAFNEDVAKTLSSGMNAHVAKPIEPELLAAALDKAFGK